VTPRQVQVRRPEALREHVRDRYGQIATAGGCCGGPAGGSSCCAGSETTIQLGYTDKELAQLPAGADLGLGCGHPTGLASLRAGEAVLDLGSGAGIDCFLASQKVGRQGRVIGVDMTPEMVAKARANARTGRYRNVEFRLGEIEHLPVPDGSVDVVISNCVINLAPDKEPVYREAFRVLRPGGRLAVSDVVASRRITARERADPSLWSSCSSGALDVKAIERLLRRAGFEEVRIDSSSPEATPDKLRDQASLGVFPANIRATKPGA
jgi:arsenite methyltransferase